MRTPARNHAGGSLPKMRCTEISAGKVVKGEKESNLKFRNSTVATLRKIFEPSSPTGGLVEGPLQLFQAGRPKMYTPELDLKICASQSEDAKQNEPRDILDWRVGASQDWPEMSGK